MAESKERKGPPASATLHAVGARKKGNDGAMWVVIATSAGVHRWKREGARKPKTKVSKSKMEKKEEKKAPKSRSTYHIQFCEPYTFAVEGRESKPFAVSDHFYANLLKAPKKYKTKSANAYVFGKLFGLKGYKLIAEHDNDGAQTGFLDMDLYSEKKQNEARDFILGRYTKTRERWDARSLLRAVRNIYPHVLFLGETVGGDVGASLYAHYGVDRKIDSLIIDNNYFFPRASA